MLRAFWRRRLDQDQRSPGEDGPIFRAAVQHREQTMLRRLACAIAFIPSFAAAQDAQQGREIALRWCSSCHVVERTATSAPTDGLPTFPGIAARPGLSADQLRAAMNPQHSRMPDLALSKRQQDDLVAYIYSLRAK
jgi:mono/diheme cytochrome c family protein